MFCNSQFEGICRLKLNNKASNPICKKQSLFSSRLSLV
uniref:Uncharacterized protein n=1 Tax=Siphoviridae sp. ctqpo8 TaxID=2826469 RepID=A0A8S5M2S0_9CAUD|nr:MAG TPA: hypothetical protein [Siphoviridae sp. ctqpo8]